jgi:hypothetical protein
LLLSRACFRFSSTLQISKPNSIFTTCQKSLPRSHRYSFPIPLVFDSKANYNTSKTIQNLTGIEDFRKDYKKVEKLILDNFENCCDSKIYQIIEKGSKAYVSVSRNNGYDFYTVKLNSDNEIVINLVSSIIE